MTQRPPQTFDQLKARITRDYGELSGRLRQIAEFALHHPNDMALDTVAAIAERAGVQPSSIIRFANSFGYGGFSEMQKVFRSQLVAHSASYRDRIAALRRQRANGGSGTAPGEILAGFVDDGIAALDRLHAAVRPADLERAVDLMARAATVHVLAQGRAFPVAFYVFYALRRLDRKAHLVDGVGGMLRQQARMATRDDLILAVSFKDYTREVVEVAAEAKAQGVKTLAISDSALSPLAEHAVLTLEAPQDEAQPFRSLVAPICLAQSLVVALGHRLAATERERPRAASHA